VVTSLVQKSQLPGVLAGGNKPFMNAIFFGRIIDAASGRESSDNSFYLLWVQSKPNNF
jgi:hypothetical protein